ncbi:MAG: hypothetical protein ACTSPY_16980 [Candidatus Helarchaeota archaeon]
MDNEENDKFAEFIENIKKMIKESVEKSKIFKLASDIFIFRVESMDEDESKDDKEERE